MSNQPIPFRPTDKNLNRILWARTMGVNISEVMNELMERGFDEVAKKKAVKTAKELERAKGFEPSTFTLAR